VTLDQVHLLRRPTRLPVRGLQRAQLAFGTGRQQVPFNIGGEANATNQRVDPVPVAQCVTEAFEYHYAGAFTHNQSVTRLVEWGAAPSLR
jgi:hypothetical protein